MTNIVSSFEPVLDPTRTLPPPISSLEKSTLTFIPRTPTTAAPKWVVLLSNRSFELGFVRVGYFDLRWLREMVRPNLAKREGEEFEQKIYAVEIRREDTSYEN
ncbi:hypothetical protein FXO38_00284 [Capsicum annuum]|nr:hypothetical protein FXO38_00284 [Capsicum annuum]